MTDDRTDGGHVVERLDAWRTGELGPEPAREVEDHLEACSACRAALADLEAFAGAVEEGYRAGEATLPAPDWGARRAAIVERTSGRRDARAPWIVRWAPQVAIVAVAAVAIGILVEKGVREPGDVERALRAPVEERASRAIDEPRADRESPLAPPVAEDEEASRPNAAPEPVPGDDRVEGRGERPETPSRPAPSREEAVAEPAAEPPPEARVDPDAGLPAATQKAAPTPAGRFQQRARAALEASDSSGAREALRFWADSVEPAELPEERAARLRALADSLAGLLSSLP